MPIVKKKKNDYVFFAHTLLILIVIYYRASLFQDRGYGRHWRVACFGFFLLLVHILNWNIIECHSNQWCNEGRLGIQ